jgi:hypothetical protein
VTLQPYQRANPNDDHSAGRLSSEREQALPTGLTDAVIANLRSGRGFAVMAHGYATIELTIYY